MRKPTVRTLHHFACTGGTLFSRCLAAMPGTLLLSEIDPLSTKHVNLQKPRFEPSDLSLQLRQSAPGCSRALLIALFQAQLKLIAQDAHLRSLRLILRDHAHSHFCMGETVPERPSLAEIVSAQYPVLSLVTVRDPIDSFASLIANEWIEFSPATLDEYCRRYIEFLDRYETCPILRYEDLLADPERTMRRACQILKLPFDIQFIERQGNLRVTGDSGRSGNDIAARPRRELPTSLLEEASSSENYQKLIKRLGYSAV